MAALTLATEVAEVRVVVPMAGNAILGELHHVRWLAMAPGAGQLLVGAGQAKAGLLAMIEFPEPPAIRGMAARTFLAETALVHIHCAVTVIACSLGLLESRGEMTLLARYCRMLAQQWKIAQIVIETDIESPARGRMTGLALTAKPGGVHIARCMTAAAGGRQ